MTDRIGGQAIKVRRAVANAEARPKLSGNVATMRRAEQPRRPLEFAVGGTDDHGQDEEAADTHPRWRAVDRGRQM